MKRFAGQLLADDVTSLAPIGVHRPDVSRARGDIQQGAAGLDLEVR